MKALMPKSKRSIVQIAAVVLIAALSFGVSTIVASGSTADSSPSPQPEAEPWPTFTMIYRVTEDLSGTEYSPGEVVPPTTTWIRTYRLEWSKNWEWTKTLLSDNHKPHREGSTAHYSDMVLTETYPDFEAPQVTAGGPIVPDFVFAKWSQVGEFQKTAALASADLFRRDFQWNCGRDPRDACAGRAGEVPAAELVSVDRNSEIPLLFEVQVGGATVYKFEVIDLQVIR